MTRRTFPLVVFAFALALVGCDKDEIRTYTAPKPPPEPTRPVKVRLLAGIFNVQAKEQWFFKLAGNPDEVGALAGPFEAFLRSLRFPDKATDPIQWALPMGWEWEKSPAGGLRYATVFPAGKGKTPELTVSRFDRVSPLLDNVNRWARQDLGLPEMDEEDILEKITPIEAGPVKGAFLNLTGPGPKAGGPPPMMPGGEATPRKPSPLPISYASPAGWVETGPRGGFVPILTAFDVGGKAAELQVTQLGAMTGDPLLNLNRWRGQVGMRPVEKMEPAPTAITVGGASGQFFDLDGGPGGKRMFLAVVKRGQQTWYFKLMGQADTVGKNRAAFDSFVRSVQFTGGSDE